MRSADTTDAARDVLLQVRRDLGDDHCVGVAGDMSEDLRRITLDGIRERHPGVSEPELVLLLIELWHGQELGSAVRAFVAGR